MKSILIRFLIAGAILYFSFPVPLLRSEDLAVVAINLNGENKGEFVVGIGEESDFLVAESDLAAIGIRNPQGRLILIENKKYISLKSMSGIRFTFEEAHLTIQIMADPQLLKRTELNFAAERRQDFVFPHDSSFLLNYGIRQDIANKSAFTITQEAAMRIGDFLLISNSNAALGADQVRATRLMTSLTRDNRKSLTRTVLGDVYASSGNLGSMLLLGGFSYGKSYSIEPSFVKRPAMDYTGFLSLPSQVDVYLDGVQMKSEKLSPGEFDLKNIAAAGGRHGLEVRIRDSLGREQVMDTSFYSSESLLQKGLHDYSYNAGVLRSAYGVGSNRYSGLAFSGFHRYGLTSYSTIGFRMEAGKRLFNGGPQWTLGFSRYGVLDASVSIDFGKNVKRGAAASLSHTYLGRHINMRVQGIVYSHNYHTVSSMQFEDAASSPRYLIEAGIGIGNKKLGSISAGISGINQYAGTNRNLYSVTYSRSLTKTASLSTTYQHARQGQSDNQIHASLTWYLHKDTTFSSTFQRQDQASSEAVQIQKNPPTGEGFSYRALLQRNDMAGQSVTVANPYVQFNSRYGVFTTEYRSPNGNSSSDSGSFAVSAAGSMVYASGAWGFSRPISDSFAIIDANSLKNVRVYFNNHEIGATDQSGKIVIPMLNSYVENLLAINDQDIPINYVLENVSERISPAWRGGARIHFNSKKTQAFSGKLVLKSKKGEQPVEFESALIQLNNSSLKFTAGRDGEFYLENLQPGEYPASLKMDQREYSFTIKIPDAEQVFVNLGTVTIETGD